MTVVMSVTGFLRRNIIVRNRIRRKPEKRRQGGVGSARCCRPLFPGNDHIIGFLIPELIVPLVKCLTAKVFLADGLTIHRMHQDAVVQRLRLQRVAVWVKTL